MKFFAVTATVLSVFSGIVAAQWPAQWGKEPNPTLDSTLGAITKPGLHEQVPVGKPYAITWDVSPGVKTVNLILYKGPGNNIIPHSLVGANLANSGSFAWTPSTDFPNVIEGWGLRIIAQDTGATQWSTQFGFLNDKSIPDEVSSTTTVTATATTTKTGTVTVTGTSTVSTTKNSTVITTTTLITSTKNSTSTTTTASSSTATGATTTVVDTETETEKETSPAVKTTAADSGARANAASFGMGLVAVAVAGFALF